MALFLVVENPFLIASFVASRKVFGYLLVNQQTSNLIQDPNPEKCL